LAEVLLSERLAASPPVPATLVLFEAAEGGLPARVEQLLREERNTMTRMNLVSLLATAAFAVGLGGATLAANLRLMSRRLRTTAWRSCRSWGRIVKQ
jgi:hypothetical protein